MSDKSKSIYFAILALVYLAYVLFVIKHELHLTSVLGILFVVSLAVYFYLKSNRKN